MSKFRILATAEYTHLLTIEAETPEQAKADAVDKIRSGESTPIGGPGITFTDIIDWPRRTPG